jgi:flagella basal body P-ring formation protein FlgA
MKNFCSLLYTVLLLAALPTQAGTQSEKLQSHAVILKAVTAFVQAQTHNLPGQVSIKVDDIDQRVKRSACPVLETFLPPGSQLLGSGMVGVRCPGEKGWSLFVPVHVTVSVDMLIANKALPQGHVLIAEDLSSQHGELAQMDILIDPAQAVGKILKYGVGAGQMLKQDMLRAPYVVTQGQMVQLQVAGTGFNIRSEGQALGNAADGQTVQVKTASGQIISGTARPGGTVEIRP